MIVGITGGIGSGKSYICRRLAQQGFAVYVCDDEAKRLMQEDEEIRRQLISLIGPEAYTAEGLNRSKVAEYLFANSANARNINNIVHPAVRADMRRWASRQGDAICFVESAILIEAGFDKDTDFVVMIYADQPTRLSRAMQRDKASESSIRERMNQQLDPELVRQRADYVLDNSNGTDTEYEISRMIGILRNK